MDFHSIERKFENGERLTVDEGLYLFQLEDFEPVRSLAARKTMRLHGDRVFYVINQHINYSNICTLRKVCKFCSFARLRHEGEAYELSLEEILAKAGKSVAMGVTEIHIVGGLHPSLPFSYYRDMLATLHHHFPRVQLKCFTAVEIEHLARMAKQSIPWVLSELREAGLKSLTGGGIEIMSQRVRDLICKQKLDADGWLDIVRTAHHLGIRSNATVLFGHLETRREILEHMDALRCLQDETGGFLSFIPLRFHPEGNALSHLPGPTDDETLRVIAMSRLMLDNFDHIKSYWISMGIDLAHRSLHFGANDVDGTVMEEHIYHMAGAATPLDLAVSQIRDLITSAGRTPVERDALYQSVL